MDLKSLFKKSKPIPKDFLIPFGVKVLFNSQSHFGKHEDEFFTGYIHGRKPNYYDIILHGFNHSGFHSGIPFDDVRIFEVTPIAEILSFTEINLRKSAASELALLTSYANHLHYNDKDFCEIVLRRLKKLSADYKTCQELIYHPKAT